MNLQKYDIRYTQDHAEIFQKLSRNFSNLAQDLKFLVL